MRRHHDASAVRQFRRLVGRRGGLALHRRLGLDDLEGDAGRKLDADGRAVEHREHADHAFLQVDRLVAEHLVRHDDLVVALLVHERVAVGILVEIREVRILDEGALDLLGRLVAVGRLHAVGEPAHVDLRRRRALAGMEALGGEHDIELAVLALDDVALADGTGDDFHGRALIETGKERASPTLVPSGAMAGGHASRLR